MSFPESQVAWMLANRVRILRLAFVLQALVALALLGVAYLTGNTTAHLLLSGVRTQGKIVGFQQRQVHTHRNPSSTGMYGRNVYLPIVEFEVDGELVRFEETKLITKAEGVGWQVPVLYDLAEPSRAMIDRPFWNWIPWAPALAMGLFLLMASLKGLFVFLTNRRASDLAVSA
jgi:uncharacterized protein DUF3592